MSEISQFAVPGEQKSIEWLMERVGHCTASRFKDVLDKLKSGKSGAKREAYLWEIAIERLTQKPAQHYESAAMAWGTENEPLARMAFEARTGQIVTEVGFLRHPMLEMTGGSPDGLIDDDGGWEAKCPFNSAHHLACFLTGMPEEHMAQIQGLMSVTDRAYWIFSSFDPRMPPPLDLYVKHIERDSAYIDDMEAEIGKFLYEVDALVAKLQAIKT